jgi:hypothetical protein
MDNSFKTMRKDAVVERHLSGGLAEIHDNRSPAHDLSQGRPAYEITMVSIQTQASVIVSRKRTKRQIRTL